MATAAIQKTIAVVGATGIQGSSVAHTFLSLNTWHVRCLTRDPSSTRAADLASHGAEIVRADLDDISSLTAAFAGAHAIFVNTDFWAAYRGLLAAGVDEPSACKTSFDTEVARGKNAVQAALVVSTLERFIYSGFTSMKRVSGGRFHRSHHWETKAAVVDYIFNEAPVLAAKTSIIYMGAYNTNKLLHPRFNATLNAYVTVSPIKRDRRVPIVDAAKSTGLFVRALVESEAPGTRLLAYDTDSYLTLGEIEEIWARVTGKRTILVETTIEELHAATGMPFEVLESGPFLNEYDYCAGVEGLIEPGQLKEPVKTPSFEEFLGGADLEALTKE